jgi:hypothetical protein
VQPRHQRKQARTTHADIGPASLVIERMREPVSHSTRRRP